MSEAKHESKLKRESDSEPLMDFPGVAGGAKTFTKASTTAGEEKEAKVFIWDEKKKKEGTDVFLSFLMFFFFLGCVCGVCVCVEWWKIHRARSRAWMKAATTKSWYLYRKSWRRSKFQKKSRWWVNLSRPWPKVIRMKRRFLYPMSRLWSWTRWFFVFVCLFCLFVCSVFFCFYFHQLFKTI